MSGMIVIVLLGLIATTNANPGKHHEQPETDLGPAADTNIHDQPETDAGPVADANIKQLLQELTQKHKADMALMSAELAFLTTKLALVSSEMASVSQKHENEIERLSQDLQEAQGQIALLEDLQKSPDADTSPGTINMNNMMSKIIHEINNTLLHAYTSQFNQASSTGVVAFYCRIESFTGSPTGFATIPFDIVDLNIGGGYDSSNGQFTAPVSGIYSLSYELLADSACGTAHICCGLYVNSILVSQSCGKVYAGGSATVNIQMAAGEVASVVVNYNFCLTIGDGVTYNKYSGHLVHQII